MSNFQCECIELNLQTPSDYFGRFVFKPLGPGDGITIGNIFRRVLLTNLPGLSIVGVRIEGINHEFSSIPGVREDVLEILLNLKELIFKSTNPSNSYGRIKIQGPAIVTASCIDLAPDIEIVNPSHYIASLSDNSILEMELKLEWGSGYTLAENQVNQGPLDYLKVDSIFMPIRRVVYKIETNDQDEFEREEELFLDVWTNGSITPPQALSLASQIIRGWFTGLENLDPKSLPEESLSLSLTQESDMVKDLPIEDLDLSARSYNALKRAQIHLIGDLLKYSLNDLLKIKSFGQKSLKEVSEALELQYDLFLD
jgi:DNA-directed RNA polymerase subunit alpha